MLKRWIIAAAAMMTLAGPAAAQQDWPNKPITIVVPYAAGGPVDTIARILAARMSELMGQQLVVENQGGAGGQTGSRASRNRRPTATPCCSRAAPRWRRTARSISGRPTTP